MSRRNSSLNFNRTWAKYKHGFGDVNTDHWIGKEAMCSL